jgi:hypothetical protein
MTLVFLAVVASPLGTSAQLLPEGPRAFLDTTYSPPVGGTTIQVNAGGNLQAALNQAQPGDIVQLQAGATFTGNFTLPNKAGSGWIYIRSSAHASLPPPGQRVGPAQAALMPKIVSPNTSPALTADLGAHHYRFVGLEIATTWATRTSTHSNVILLGYDLNGNAATSPAELPHHMTFDRCYVHGTPTGNVLRGLAANSASTAVVDSYFADFHSTGNDSQAIISWNGAGPFKIVNNYLEAAAENVMFGGADPDIANLVPSDIEIRHNYFFKPLSWKQGHPTYAGILWSVKNLFELKNAQRVLVDGNVFENIWPAAQAGFALQLTVRNQDGNAPWSIVQDVTFTRNLLRHLGGGVNFLGLDDIFTSQQARRFLIRDNVFEDVTTTGTGARLFQILNAALDVTIAHNTAFHNGPTVVADQAASPRLTFRDNIVPENQGVIGSGTGAGLATLNFWFPGYVYRRNVQPDGNASAYPPDNFFPATLGSVGFVDLAGGDYRLAVTSPYRNAGTDGKDIGADVGAVNTATAGVVTGVMSDITPPTVSVTAPAPGVTVSGSVTVSATAMDNAGVVGVQFKLDGVNLGTEDTTPPYAVTWNTTAAAGGVHSLTAVARDAAGNMTTSAPVSVTVNNGSTGPPAAPSQLIVQ